MVKTEGLPEKNIPITVVKAESSHDIREFVNFQYRHYKGNKNFVPPLRKDMKSMVTGKTNPLFKRGPVSLFIARKNGQTAGRIAAGIDEDLNAGKNSMNGYITLFESVDDYEVAKMLFDRSTGWLKEMGMTMVKGPVSPTGGDDTKGLLIDCFDRPPVLMNSYNYSYYPDFFEKYGFCKDLDLYAYYYDVEKCTHKSRKKVVEYAMKRYEFKVDSIDLDNVEKEIVDIKRILDIAMPEDWDDLVPPSLDEIRGFAGSYRKLAEPRIICIARSNEGTPVGFLVSLPNFNEVFIKMNGRLFPFGFLKLLNYKKHIKSGRTFILFVIPEYRKKGVSGAMFYKVMNEAKNMDYIYGEGSTIGETNYTMRRDADRAGGEHYKTYRIYGLEI